jgi:hypothetical protein
MVLSASKSAQIAGIFAAAPDDALRRLTGLLATASLAESALAPVHDLAAAESQVRRIADFVFEPLLPLTEAAERPRRRLIDRGDLTRLWRTVAAQDGPLAERVSGLVRTLRCDADPPPEFDTVCTIAARHSPAPELARWLRLAPVLRRVEPRLGAWVRNLSGENIAAVRLAFKDALAIDEDAGPAFWEAVFAMLEAPYQVIRLISAVIDRPSDRYLADSELADLGERLLADVDDRIMALKTFDVLSGETGGAAVAAAIAVAVQTLGEFEQWLALGKDGPWGQRVHAQKQALSLSMEARLREVEPALAAALPTQAARGPSRGVRAVPRLTAEPNPLHCARAEALLTLLDESRSSDAAGGFAALRAKTIEAVENRLDHYCEELIEALHNGEIEDPDRARAFLDVAADFTGLIKGPLTAQIVRRRAAAA